MELNWGYLPALQPPVYVINFSKSGFTIQILIQENIFQKDSTDLKIEK